MSRLNYARQAAMLKARHNGEPIEREPSHRPKPAALKGTREEWDGEPFPVTVTRIPAPRDGKELAA